MPATRKPNNSTELPDGSKIDYFDNVGVDGLPQRRRYVIDGQRAVSVSTVANVMPKDLTGWAYKIGVEAGLRAAELGAKTLDEAKYIAQEEKLTARDVLTGHSERGSEAHGIAETMLQEKLEVPWISIEANDFVNGYHKASAKFTNECVERVLHTELTVASKSLCVSGRLDAVCLLSHKQLYRGKPFYAIVDFKTTARKDVGFNIYNSHIAQLSGYGLCYQESYQPDVKIKHGVIVRLHEDGSYSCHLFSLKPHVFKTCLKMYEADRLARKLASDAASLVVEQPQAA